MIHNRTGFAHRPGHGPGHGTVPSWSRHQAAPSPSDVLEEPRRDYPLGEAYRYCERMAQAHYENVPVAVFGNPEVGAVGLTEEEARERYDAVDIYRAVVKPLPNRIAGRDERMLIKLVVDGDSDRVLGCHFVGPSASELVQLVAVAIRMGATKADFDATTALHPTLAEEIVTLGRPAERIRRQAAE